MLLLFRTYVISYYGFEPIVIVPFSHSIIRRAMSFRGLAAISILLLETCLCKGHRMLYFSWLFFDLVRFYCVLLL
jgi:hypothetical protein